MQIMIIPDPDVDTRGGSDFGGKCVFPFLANGTEHKQCIVSDDKVSSTNLIPKSLIFSNFNGRYLA